MNETVRRRVLVVDDNDGIRDGLKSYLTAEGFAVDAAGSSETALGLLGHEPPEVALLDILLPGMSGLELAGEIRQRCPDCEVVMMTSFASVDTAVEAIRRGAYDYLQKPFGTLERVLATVEKALAKRTQRLDERSRLARHAQQNDELCDAIDRIAALIEDRVVADSLLDEEEPAEPARLEPDPQEREDEEPTH